LNLLVRLEMIVFGADLYSAGIYYYSLLSCTISELCRPIAAKFCTMMGSVFDLVILV